MEQKIMEKLGKNEMKSKVQIAAESVKDNVQCA